MFELLFNPSYWMVGLAIAVALGLLYFGMTTLQKQLTTAAWAALVVALAWATAALLIETSREIATRGTREFVAAVVSGDTGTQGRWLSSEASLFQLDRAGILAAAKTYVPQYGIKSASLFGLTSTDAGETVSVSFRCWAELAPDRAASGRQVPTDWRFTFFKYANGIQIQRIEFQGMGNGTPGDVDQFNTRHFSQNSGGTAKQR